MKFYIQTIGGKIEHDFSFTLLKAIEFQSWSGNEIDFILSDEISDKIDFNEYCPIGSVEFVCNWYAKFYNKQPKPVNIPERLLGYEYTKRNCQYLNLPCKNISVERMFLKDTEKIKNPLNGEYKSNRLDKLPSGRYFASELINIDSEYRCFVYNNTLVGIQYYSGDFTIFPDMDFIKKTINDSISFAPPAYTLDVGISELGTFIIEMHDFFSCGLYGFSDLRKLPFMFFRSHKNLIQ